MGKGNTFVILNFILFLISASVSHSSTGSSGEGPPKVTLVYFLGGCTYSEIAALRFLAQQENGMLLVFYLNVKPFLVSELTE